MKSKKMTKDEAILMVVDELIKIVVTAIIDQKQMAEHLEENVLKRCLLKIRKAQAKSCRKPRKAVKKK